MFFDLQSSFALIVLGFIIVCGFLTVVFVVYVGSKEHHSGPNKPSESQAVSVWTQRAEARQQALTNAEAQSPAES